MVAEMGIQHCHFFGQPQDFSNNLQFLHRTTIPKKKKKLQYLSLMVHQIEVTHDRQALL